MKLRINWWKIRAAIYFKWMHNETITGYSSRTTDGKHILMLDYDDLPEEYITMEIQALQQLYELSNFYLFKTEHGYHAICLDKISLAEYKTIISDTCSDRNQWLIPMLHGKKTINLRISAKNGKTPTYIKTINCKQHYRTQSLPHAKLLWKMGITIPDDKLFDKEEKLLSCEYKI